MIQKGAGFRADFGALAVVSLYLPSGSSGNARQKQKFCSMQLLLERLCEMREQRTQAIVEGDVNIAHTNKDIRWENSRRDD